MLQNMQNAYNMALKSSSLTKMVLNTSAKSSEFYRSVAVAYMTINMTLSSLLSAKATALLPPGTQVVSRVEEWVDSQMKSGQADTSLLASVEIIGAGQ
jgi:hypothetical protein